MYRECFETIIVSNAYNSITDSCKKVNDLTNYGEGLQIVTIYGLNLDRKNHSKLQILKKGINHKK